MKFNQRTAEIIGKCADIIESVGQAVPTIQPIAAIIFWGFIVDIAIATNSI